MRGFSYRWAHQRKIAGKRDRVCYYWLPHMTKQSTSSFHGGPASTNSASLLPANLSSFISRTVVSNYLTHHLNTMSLSTQNADADFPMTEGGEAANILIRIRHSSLYIPEGLSDSGGSLSPTEQSKLVCYTLRRGALRSNYGLSIRRVMWSLPAVAFCKI